MKEIIRAVGNMVLLKFKEVKASDVSKGGIIKVKLDIGPKEKPIYRGYVLGIGDNVDRSKIQFKEGDAVIWNDYDCKSFKLDVDDEESPIYGLVKAESIWAVYNEIPKDD